MNFGSLLSWVKREPAVSVGAVAVEEQAQESTEVPVKEPVPVAAAESVTIPKDEFVEYCRIAEKIGWKSAAIIEEKLRHFFAESAITVYPFEKVEKFLDSEFGLAQNGTPTWYWRPLREKDMQANLMMNASYLGRNGQIENDGWYNEEIPVPVMLTIEKIHDEIPEACLYISESIEEGDPFLMVTGPGNVELFVIERWNEPSFRM